MYTKSSVIWLLIVGAVLTLAPSPGPAADAADYAIRWSDSTPPDDLPAALLAANPAQGFDARIAPEGLRVRPREGDWAVELALLRVGREGALREVEPAGVEIRGLRAELHRGTLVEWYVNDERGLEQGLAAEGSGYILASGCEIPKNSTDDRVDHFFKYGHQYGQEYTSRLREQRPELFSAGG